MKLTEILLTILAVAFALFSVYLAEGFEKGWFEPRPTVESLQAEFPSWSAEDCKQVVDGYIWIGMTSDMARKSWGTPSTINRTVSDYSVREQWVYRSDHRPVVKTTYLYFVDGVLTSWQD